MNRFLRGLSIALSLLVLAPLRAVGAESGIQWYATWDSGYKEARRTGRPIMLVSAAPHCHNVPGIW